MSLVLITTDHLLHDEEVESLLTAAGHRIRHLPHTGARDVDELVAALDDVEGAIIANEPMTADVLGRAYSLRALVRSGVGYDSVDVDAATRLGISVSNLPGVNSNAVAEYTLALLLAAARGLVPGALGVAGGRWPREGGRELRGSTLGLVGYGASARVVAGLARAFGMTVLCTTSVPEAERTDPSVRFVDLGTLLRESDHVSLHTALTPRTRHLVDAEAFALMKPTAVLVNTARGGLVDEAALVEAVTTGRIAGAQLDVVDVEPLPAGSPLRGVDGITVYSHMAGQTADSRRAAAVGAARELVAALDGEPRSSLNADLIAAQLRSRGWGAALDGTLGAT
ncbi:NAD(P)-dependent oxidoreductase [Umezawaea tangerina]|uniref:D-3-phosphoglycerate dehydrogenase n=1 Tax=Umezawaea tangerina TaxID=84725 RepID=A0A2T0TGI2_9PSEU|nr:NAD(P)-dependent oxidoreductase [Umezawaea tangerina]PRY44797.1 D-3-phosphoglycerate dehydrogenase [Umezawaea tangerina]